MRRHKKLKGSINVPFTHSEGETTAFFFFSKASSQPSAFPTAAETKPGSGSPESLHRCFTRSTKTAGSRSKRKLKWRKMHGGGEGGRKVNCWRKACNLPRFLYTDSLWLYISELQYWYVSKTSWCSERFFFLFFFLLFPLSLPPCSDLT